MESKIFDETIHKLSSINVLKNTSNQIKLRNFIFPGFIERTSVVLPKPKISDRKFRYRNRKVSVSVFGFSFFGQKPKKNRNFYVYSYSENYNIFVIFPRF